MIQADGGAMVVHPEVRTRRLVAIAAVAVLAADIGAIAVLGSSDVAIRPLGWLAGFAIVALIRTAGWSTIRSIRLDGESLVLVHADRTERAIPVAEIGGLAYRGSLFAGRLFDGFFSRGNADAGRVVVLDRRGSVLVARRAGWFLIRDLEQLAAAAGIWWRGPHEVGIPIVPVAPPVTVPVLVERGVAALDAPATRPLLARLVRARRIRLGSYLAVFATGVALCFVGAWLPEGRQPEGAVIFVGVIAILVGLVLLLLAPLNDDRPRPIKRVLRATEWALVELVVVPAITDDRSKRSVGVCGPERPDGHPVRWSSVRSGGGRGWLQEGTRGWFWVARGPGKRSVVAPLDLTQAAIVTTERTGRRFQQKHDEAYQAAADLERWQQHVAGWAAAPGPPAPPAASAAPPAGWGSAPMSAGGWSAQPTVWGPPSDAAPAPVPPAPTGPPGWTPPPAWAQPPAWEQPTTSPQAPAGSMPPGWVPPPGAPPADR